MASKPVELPLSIWAPPGSPLRIEYSGEAMEEIRARAVDGFYKVTRGGVDVAGLLLGVVQAESIRILAQLPFEIEYAYGPAFVLSSRDLALIRKLVEDVSRAGLEASGPEGAHRVLGLYISHARSGLELAESEVQLFDQIFPHAWQTVLLLKPSHSPETAAAFFVREPSGEIRSREPRGIFAVTPLMGERRARRAYQEASSLRALAEAARQGPSAESSATTGSPSAKPLAREAPENELSGREPSVQPESPQRSPAPDRAELSQEEILARRALPDVSVVPPAAPPPAAPAERGSFSATEPPQVERPAIPAEAPVVEASATEDPAPPMPLAAQADAASSAPPDAVEPELAEPHPDTLEWHEEKIPAGAVRATSWMRWAIPAVALILLLVLGYLVYHALNGAPPSVVFFRRAAGDGQEVVWRLQGLGDARSAVITIKNGAETRTIDLIRTGQLSGVYRDPSLASASAVTMDIERGSGEKIHREAPPLDADSVVPYLGGFATPEAAQPATPEAVPAQPDAESRTSPEPILATPIPVAPAPTAPVAERKPEAPAATPPAASPPSPLPAPERRTAEAAAVSRPSVPEMPVQARITEAPPPAAQPAVPAAKPAAPRPDPVSRASASPPVASNPLEASPPRAVTPDHVENRPASPPAAPVQPPAATPHAQPRPAPKPASARIAAGRVIWVGQLRKNQNLQINGKAASIGLMNGSLPGQPVQVNVHPAELTPQGLVVFTANPKYRNAANAVEPPGPTNGWNQTQYRYDPARAQSLIVTGPPSEANGWIGVTVRNDDKNASAIVIDWQASEP